MSQPVRDPADFVGREREIVQITEALAAGRSCCVVGPEGSGKSSLLIHLGQASALVLDEPPAVVYCQLDAARTPGDIYAPILRALGKQGDDELALGQALYQAPHPLVLLLLDNLEAAGAGWTSLVRSALRGWINDGALLVVAASAKPLSSAAPDMQTALTQISLTPMPEREARELVTHLAARAERPLAPGDLGTLIATAGGYPGRIATAVELWARSDGGADFDWKRRFREQYPEQATLADEVRGWASAFEGERSEPQATLTPNQARVRTTEPKPKREKNYRLEDPSEFLLMIALVALAAGVWWAIGAWWGVVGFVAALLLYVGIAHLVVRGHPARQSSLYVEATRLLPFVGRWAPPRP